MAIDVNHQQEHTHFSVLIHQPPEQLKDWCKHQHLSKERAKRGEYNGYNAETTTTTAAAETVKIRSKDKDKIFKILQKYRRHYANN